MTRDEKIQAVKAAADALLVGMPPNMQQRYRDTHDAIYDALHVNLICHDCEIAPATVDRGTDGVACAACDNKFPCYQPGPDDDLAYELAVGK